MPGLQAMKAVRVLEGWLRDEAQAAAEAREAASKGRSEDEDALRRCLEDLTETKVRGGTALSCICVLGRPLM